MSKWSGKCDCYDTLIAIHNYTLEELQNDVVIYVGANTEPLHIEKMSDLIPFYPYIICSSFHDNKERKAVIHLTSESYVDREERNSLEFMLKELLRIYNRCKRKKIEFNAEDAIKEVVWNGWNEEAYRELAGRIKLYGKKATTNGVHLKMHEIYRQELVDEMLKNGLNPADYGDYQRFIK